MILQVIDSDEMRHRSEIFLFQDLRKNSCWVKLTQKTIAEGFAKVPEDTIRFVNRFPGKIEPSQSTSDVFSTLECEYLGKALARIGFKEKLGKLLIYFSLKKKNEDNNNLLQSLHQIPTDVNSKIIKCLQHSVNAKHLQQSSCLIILPVLDLFEKYMIIISHTGLRLHFLHITKR